jgi:hypothetical protein
MNYRSILSFIFPIVVSLTGVGDGALAEVPADAQLDSHRATIRRIDIQIDDVFEKSKFLAWPYRITNSLHINSRQSTVEAQLLFRVGDVFDRRVLDETERLLRDQRYLNEATIEVTLYDEASNTVDLLVRVHDVWTLSPGIAFGRKGGANSTRIELEENNLLGLGKRIEFWSSHDVDRTSLRVRYQDPNLIGSRWRLATAYASSSDGGEKTIDLEHPFYSLETRWSAGVLASDLMSSVARYRQGEVVERFRGRRQLLEISAGTSDGLEHGWVRRYLAGLRYDGREFSSIDSQLVVLPANHTVSYPWLGVELLQDNYVKTRNFDQIRRTEDVHLGLSMRVEAGYEAPAFGSTYAGVVVKSSLEHGVVIGDRQHLIGALKLGGRIENGELRNGILDIGTRYYLRQNSFSAFFASAAMTMTSNPDPETQLMLGGDNGLRGYPLRYQSGSSRALVTMEERFYTGWQPLRLVDVGAAMFFDAGRVWGSDPYGGESLGWLRDFGIGLRLGNARSALGNVIHIDLAFPLDGPKDISSMQWVVETHRSF